MIRITDLNPYGGIGANSMLVEVGPYTVVVDSGLHPKEVGTAAMPAIASIRGRKVDIIILTHCHLDHLGSIPVMMREHPDAILLVSTASEKLVPRLLRNSYNVMMRQREEFGVAEYPLFSRAEIGQMKRRTYTLDCGHPRFFGSGGGERLAITFHHAGHVPGAVGVTLDYGHRRIFCTGDVLFTPQHILAGAKFPRDQVDVLVTETTRGANPRAPGEDRKSEIDRLLKRTAETLENGGSVLIPAFALGRMQEVLAILHKAVRRGKIPAVPVFASGLGLDLCDYFDEISRKSGDVYFRRYILKDLAVRKVPDDLVPGRPPSHRGIYVLSSGMIVPNTASYAAAASLLADPKSTICFVGYCDPDSPGGAILAAEEDGELVFDAIEFKTQAKAGIEKFDLSSHADREELLDFALAVRPRHIVLTHGDADARAWFAEALKQANPAIHVVDPIPLEPVEID